MAIREDSGAALTLVDGGDGTWSPAEAAPAHARRDWQPLYEQERARAAAAEARCEELRRAELASRSRAGSLKSQLDASRNKLKAAAEEIREVRRTAKNALALQAEVTRLEKLLSEAGVESSKRSTIMSLRKEVARLRAAVPASEACRPRGAPRRSRNPEETIASLREENARLKKEVRAAKDLGGRVKFLDREIDNHRSWLRGSHDHIQRLEARHRDEIDWLKRDMAWMRAAFVGAADDRNRTIASLRKQLDRRRAAAVRLVEARERTIAWLRERNERLRAATVRATEMIVSLREKIAGLHAQVRALEVEKKALVSRVETLEAQLAKLRASRTVLSKSLFGRKSEQQKKPRSGRKRGQQRGAPGHGRTPRPGLDERTEKRNPPMDARVCSCCRSCDCASSLPEVTAPPVSRLFDNTPYGISVWVCILFERFVCCRPLHRVSAWLADMGLAISPGTLADSVKRFVPLFEPVAKAILAHQNKAALRHADETGWRVQELRGEDRSSRAWLWTSVSSDAVCFHIDPSRSAEAAHKLFAEALLYTVIVCDRYSAYKRLARLLGGLVTLAFCWVHQRRDFIECAAGQVSLTQWCRGWVERIASIYRLNDARLEHYDPGIEPQTPAFDTAQGALNEALDALFADAERELAGLPDQAREGKALRSLLNHREGLSVFIDRPQVPLDNNLAERLLRGPAIGRRLSFGSDSETGARFTALMYSVVGTLSLNDIDVLRWLQAWLETCAKNGGTPPDDLSPWLPWSMSEERRRSFTAPA